MNQFQKNIKKNAFNEDAMLANVYHRARINGLRSKWANAPKESTMKKKSLLFISFALVITMAIMIANPFSLFGKNDSKVVAAVISVDINPSFELSVNNAGLVIKLDALNTDAESLDTSAIIGLPVEEAVDSIVALAEAAGFIDTTDLEEDYVVVTTVLNKGIGAQLGDLLQNRILDRIQFSDALQNVNVVQMKATLQERFLALDKKVPVGLYVLNGMIANEDGIMVSVKEFFANDENKVKLEKRAKITNADKEKVRIRIETALTTMDEHGVDTAELRTRLENASEKDLIKLQNEIRSQNKANKPSDETEIDEIKEPEVDEVEAPENGEIRGNENNPNGNGTEKPGNH